MKVKQIIAGWNPRKSRHTYSLRPMNSGKKKLKKIRQQTGKYEIYRRSIHVYLRK